LGFSRLSYHSIILSYLKGALRGTGVWLGLCRLPPGAHRCGNDHHRHLLLFFSLTHSTFVNMGQRPWVHPAKSHFKIPVFGHANEKNNNTAGEFRRRKAICFCSQWSSLTRQNLIPIRGLSTSL